MRKGKKIGLLFLIFITISIVVYLLFIRKPNLSPNYCFDNSDKEILILTNQDIELDTLLKDPSRLLFKKIHTRLKFRKVFFSLSKSKILIELEKNQIQNGVETILNLCGIKFIKKNNYYKLNDNWKCIFNESNIYFFKGKFKTQKTNLKLSTSNGDYTIYNLADQKVYTYKVTKSNLVKSYKNQFNTHFLNKNDFNMFGQYIPSSINSYIFYQKKYAEQNLLIDSSSAFYKMIESGFAIFSYNGHEFIIAEKNKKIDPYLLLDEENGINEIVPGLRKKYKHTFLCGESKKLNDFFYLEIFENKLFFSESKEQFELIRNIIHDKKTLKYTSREIGYVFGNQPQEAIYRKANIISRHTIVSNKQNLSEYIAFDFKKDKIKQENISNLKNVLNFVVGKKYVFVFTTDEIIKFENDREVERVKYKGDIIGSPELIDNDQGENLVFTTSEKLYCLNQDFKSIDGYPIILKSKPELPFNFTFFKQNKLLGFSDKKVFSICDSKGNVKSRLNLELENVKKSISLFESDNLSAVVYDDKSAYFIDLYNNNIINKIELKYKNTVFLTNNESQAFFYIENNELYRNGFDGDLKKCASGKRLFALKTFSNSNVVGVLSDKNLALFDVMGECIIKVKLPSKKNIDYNVVQNFEGQSYIIIEDKLSNLIYIYNFDGENILNSPLKGSEIIFLDKVGREFKIYTVLNNKFLKYLF
jgi:hypothetical protein